MQATTVALSEKALRYLKKKRINAISVDPLESPCCGVSEVKNDSVSKGKPKKDLSAYNVATYRGIDVYYPYYTNVDSDVLRIDAERILGYTRLYVANAKIDY
ncbi:MAG: hypothetical protein SPI65_02375 [Peptoniphilus sp.]|nr:hypothetical protein [Peptoniphilus sp.]MDD7363077.1 hypothetical protein [Bacillota bacterium]MDY6044405.1 hypothetical protein [Peptoniphilus sp.]